MPTPRQTRLVRATLVALGLAGALGLLLAVRANPPGARDFYPKCQSYQLLGLHCPGCGLTRAAHAALNGDFAQALAYNPLAAVVLPFLGFCAACGVVAHFRGPRRRRPYRPPNRCERVLPWLLTASLVAFGVLRNVPVYPLSLLAPHELAGR